MAKTKQETAQKIRSSITPSAVGEPLTGNKLKETTASNVAVANHVLKISDRIEKLTEHEKKFFTDLIAEVKKIPEDTEEFKKQQKAIYENLIKASAIIAKEAGEETDAEKKKNLEEILEALKKRGKDIEKELPRKAQTFKERLAAQQFGGDPDEVSKKGYFGTMFAQSKRELFGAPKPSFDERLDAEQLAAGIEQIPDKSLKEKTDDNTRATSILESSLSALLKEVTIIRKITEGSLKFDARLKGSPYYQEDTEGKKRSVSKDIARTAGTGLYTKDELGEKLELTKTETKKKKLSELESLGSEAGLLDLQKKQVESLEEIKKDIDTVADATEKQNDVNENLERATNIDTDPTDEPRFKSGGSDEESAKEVTATAEGGSEKDSEDSEEGAGGGLFSNIASAIGGILGAKGVAKVASKGAAKKAAATGAAKGTAKVAGKAGAKALLKKIPIVGLIAGVGFGVHRMMKGDMTGAAGEVLSGASSMVPGAGTAASIAIDAGLAARDIKNTQDSDVEAGVDVDMSADNIMVSQVEKTKNNIARTIENEQGSSQKPNIAPITNIVNNNYANGQQNQPAPQTVVLPVRTSDTSFIRYQDKRMTRVL
jgi:hypothetical protein